MYSHMCRVALAGMCSREHEYLGLEFESLKSHILGNDGLFCGSSVIWKIREGYM
jgi:hypothetical protein